MQWIIEPTALDWVSARLSPFFDAQVTSLVPTGFEAYARIPHPHLLDSATLLVDVLRAYTPHGERCRFAIWEGHGWVWGGILTMSTDPTRHGLRPDPDELPVPAHIRDGPRASRPHRDHVLYSGDLDDALALPDLEHQRTRRVDVRIVHDDVPDLWWPENRTWFVASDTDHDHCTYLGGTHELIAQVLAEPGLDAEKVDPHDRLI